jgi:hypothetical protein
LTPSWIFDHTEIKHGGFLTKIQWDHAGILTKGVNEKIY